MPSNRDSNIVETSWLADHLDAPDVIVLDGSLHLPTAKRDAKAEYEATHIPGALFFDIDDISADDNPLPHMLPSTVKFASKVKKLGVGDGMNVVVYDSEGMYSAARVWWMFRAMGFDDVAVLNGGLKKWAEEGRPVTDMPTPPRQPRHFTPRFDGSLVRDIEDIKASIKSEREQIVDARSPGRFAGQEAEPRQGLRAGHMPGAKNVHYAMLVNADGTLKSSDELQAAFDAQGVDLTKPIVTTCGSGVTACILSLAMAELGRTDVPVYDGSWVEYGHEASGGDVVTG